MLEESIPAAWASLNSWFTPTLLFVFLNLMIGTIAIASGLGTTSKQQQQTQDQQDQQQRQQDQHQQLVRTPSMLQRIKSINLYRYRSQDLTPFSSITTTTLQPPESEQTQHVLDSFREQIPPHSPHFDHYEDLHTPTEEQSETETETETETTETESETSFHNFEEHGHVTRTVSDTKPASGAMPVKLTKKLKKSASAKSTFSHFEEKDINTAIRPATVREGKKELQSFGDDEEVDAKADDFINRFKQQLQLQRLDFYPQVQGDAWERCR